MMAVNGTTAKALYERLKQERVPYITRAIECARLTIPSLFPKEHDNGTTKYDTPYQSIGARGVNNLASKLVLALFPPNSPFFRLSISKQASAEVSAMGMAAEDKIEAALAELERTIMRYIETHQIRVTLSEALKQAVVVGNALLFLPPKEGGIKLYKLSSYVLQRDALGNVITIVTLDKLAFASLPPNIQQMVSKNGERKPEELIEIYTHAYLEDNFIVAYQEVEGEKIEGSDQRFPVSKSPWIPIRMVKVDGESYGRSFVEEYKGDLMSLEGLSKAIVEHAAIAANITWLVNPNGVTQARKLANARPGEFIPGRRDDIAALQLEKHGDLQIAKATADAIESRLSYAFILNSAIQRDAERVTAEEIRQVARELEDTLGGIYSILSQELQLPLVRRSFAQLQSTGQIPHIPDGIVEPAITTGLEALGRGHDLNKLSMFLNYVVQIPEAAQRLKMDALLTMIGTALNIKTDTLIKSEEEFQQEQMMAQQMAMMQQAAPQLAKGMTEQQ